MSGTTIGVNQGPLSKEKARGIQGIINALKELGNEGVSLIINGGDETPEIVKLEPCKCGNSVSYEHFKGQLLKVRCSKCVSCTSIDDEEELLRICEEEGIELCETCNWWHDEDQWEIRDGGIICKECLEDE